LRWIRSTGAQAGRAFLTLKEPPVDFVFIDGDHTYEGLQEDWVAWSELVQAGGIIALHDSRSTPDRNLEQAGSARFTRDVILNDCRFETVETVDSLTVLRRVSRRA
jgi:predicted O-methyltransferase YrrM